MKTPEVKAAEEADRVQLVEALAEHPGTPWGEAVEKVAALRVKHDTLLRGVAHPMWLPSVADALEMDEPFQATASDVLEQVRSRMERTANTANEVTALRLTLEANAAVIAGLRGTVEEYRRQLVDAKKALATMEVERDELRATLEVAKVEARLAGARAGLDAALRHVRATAIAGQGVSASILSALASRIEGIDADAALAAGGKA